MCSCSEIPSYNRAHTYSLKQKFTYSGPLLPMNRLKYTLTLSHLCSRAKMLKQKNPNNQYTKKCSKHFLTKNAHTLAPTNVMKILLICQHTFRLLIWNLMSSLDEIWNSLPCMKGKEIPQQEAEHSKWVGGNFFLFLALEGKFPYIYIYIYIHTYFLLGGF